MLKISGMSVKRSWLANLVFAVLFGLSYSQDALYSSNQHTYLLHGLAEGGLGHLSADWMANTLDPFPVFSWLTSITYTYLSPFFFHVYHLILLSLFASSGMMIISTVFNLQASAKNTAYISCFAFITFSFSYAFNEIALKAGRLWTEGVAYQYLLGHVLQPSLFGVLLFFSVYQFMVNRRLQAVFWLAVAIWFHPTYLLTGALLTLSYMTIIYMEGRDYKKMILLGLLSLVLVAPVLYYNILFFSFSSTGSDKLAQNILVNFRFPHHAKFSSWFNFDAVLKILLIIGALLITKRGKVFYILLVPFIGGLLLTIVQVLTDSNFLALIFPWRVSTFLVPFSFFIVAGWLFLSIREKVKKEKREYNPSVIKAASITLMVFCSIVGVWGVICEYKDYDQAVFNPMMNYVASTAQKGQVYLIPTYMRRFRLETGMPIVVDHKTHPYKDDEVIEWYNRLQLSTAFYDSKDPRVREELLKQMVAAYKVSHVVTEEELQLSDQAEKIYADSNYFIYKITPANDPILSGLKIK